MEADQLKKQLHAEIDEIDDSNTELLSEILDMLEQQNNPDDWFDELTPEQQEELKESFERAEEDIKAGRYYTNSEFWMLIKISTDYPK